MKRISNLKLVLVFTLLTFLLTAFVIFTWEQVLRPPFFAWVDKNYPGAENQDRRWNIEQRVEHFFISITVDAVVVTLLLRLVNRQQRRLVESEARYRSLFEHANDGIGVVSAADFRLVEANSKFCEILGCAPDNVRGRDVRELMHTEGNEADSRGKLPALLRDAPASGESELTIKTLVGASLPVAVSFNTVEMEGESLTILIIRDLSARKRLEAEREEMQQQLFQTSKLASIGELSAGVAHEINNPLNGIINFAQLLKDEETPRTEFERQMIDGIIEEGGRITQIVRGLLTFARHDTHEISHLHIGETINTSISLFGRQLEKDGVKVEIDVPDNLPLIRADASRLRQVFVNMISNAHQALRAKASGDKVFRIKARRSAGHAEGDALRLEFYDNGIGIRQEDIGKVFDPFFTTRRDGDGTGLGLSISFGIIRDHGGTINVESERGRYTRFVVELPVEAEAHETPQEAVYV
jgi:PAS domain S-box-containing protein